MLLGKYEKLNEENISGEKSDPNYLALAGLRSELVNPSKKNKVYEVFSNSKAAAKIRGMYAKYEQADQVRIRYKNEDDPHREGNLLILKKPERSGNTRKKGVLYLQYNNSITEFAALFNLGKLYQDYSLIVEPSSWGYSDLGLELLLHEHHFIYVMAQDSIDYEVCSRLDKRVIPIRAGAGDWINFDAQVLEKQEKIFDVCMIASWRKLKNHQLLFKQLKTLGKGLRIALVGYPWENRTAASIRKEQSKYYPDSLVSIFESVPHQYVFQVLAQSKLALMLSEREGANRGIYEALASDVPVVMLENNRGVNKELVIQGCLITTTPDNLGNTVSHSLNTAERPDVRAKLLKISGTRNTWHKISECLKLTEGIELETNPIIRSTPNLKYISPAVKESMNANYDELETYLFQR